MTDKLWCEARCHYFAAGMDPAGRNACHETAPGGFGVKAGAAAARAHGWALVRGHWCCPACRKVVGRSRDDVVRILRDTGHSAEKALEIAIDFERGDAHAVQWVAQMERREVVWCECCGESPATDFETEAAMCAECRAASDRQIAEEGAG